MAPRVVIDTNVFAAALTSVTGSNRSVIRQCLEGAVVPVVGAALFHEYESILERPTVTSRCPLSSVERGDLLDAFLGCCQWVRIYYLWRPNLRDEADNHLIELAVAGGASCIVTNNTRDLRSGELVFPELTIVTPFAFLKLLRKSSP